LRYLDEYINARRAVADFYDSAFKNNSRLTTPYRSNNSRHVFHQYTLLLEGVNRDELHQFLADNRVPSMIYYPVPAHRQQMFASYNSGDIDLSVTDSLTEKVISLPIHTEMEEDQLQLIASKVLEFVNKK
jgi:dTDP-4-amino-4,6-dideoxygalactose transaminase